MRINKALLVAALAAAGVAATTAEAQNQLSRGSSGNMGVTRSGGASASTGGHTGSSSGRHGGNWHGPGAATGGRHWGGGHRGNWNGGWRGHGYWGPRLGLYLGVPLFWGSYYWGSPYYYDDFYYPRSTVIYRERVVDPYPASYPDEPPTTEVMPRSEGAPSQAPAYRNYCESARAYYPKVTRCPEGWRFEPAPGR
jgi:Ni/Co efflux regulator RcnB